VDGRLAPAGFLSLRQARRGLYEPLRATFALPQPLTEHVIIETEDTLREDGMCEILCLGRHPEHGHAFHEGESVPCRLRITAARLVEDEFRTDELESRLRRSHHSSEICCRAATTTSRLGLAVR